MTHGPRSAPRGTAKFRKLGLTRAGNSEPARPIPVGSLAAAQQSSCDARPRERTLGSEPASGTPSPPPTPPLVLFSSSSSSSSFFFSLQLFLLPLPTLERRHSAFVRSFLPFLLRTPSLARSLLAFFFLFFFFFPSRGPGVQLEAARQETTIALFSQEREKKTGRERGRSPVNVGENERAEASERATSPVAEGREKALSSRSGLFGGGILAGVARRDRRLHLLSFPPPEVHSETSLDGMVRTHHRSAWCPVLRDIL